MRTGKVLIDGDIVAYRAAFATQDLLPKDATDKADELLHYILEQTVMFPEPTDYIVFLTGSGNFRFEIAKSYPYKGNRAANEKPKHLACVREHMVDNWAAIVSEGEEADDLIAIAATKYGPETIVASIDKDMLQIPCRHFNFNRGDWKEVDPFEGIKFFYTQMLTGDRADNIIGLFKIGPVKADKILEGCTDEISLWNAVVKAYDGDTTRVVENARLLWLRRQENELWQPPVAIAQG
jgi:5'-3' exonuclease